MFMNCSSIDVFPIKEHVKETLKKHNLRTDKDFLAYSSDELARSKLSELCVANCNLQFDNS